MTMLSKKVPSNIKRFRELKSLTREDMASLLGMSTSGYAKIEQGMVDISISKLEKIAKLLEVHINQLINFNPNSILKAEGFTKEEEEAIGAKEHYTIDTRDIHYLEKLIESLERENELLREAMSRK